MNASQLLHLFLPWRRLKIVTTGLLIFLLAAAIKIFLYANLGGSIFVFAWLIAAIGMIDQFIYVFLKFKK